MSGRPPTTLEDCHGPPPDSLVYVLFIISLIVVLNNSSGRARIVGLVVRGIRPDWRGVHDRERHRLCYLSYLG